MPIFGNTHIISASATKLADSSVPMRKLTIRAQISGNPVYFGDGTTVMGYLTASATAGESWTFDDIRPEELYISGTGSEVLYWVGVPA